MVNSGGKCRTRPGPTRGDKNAQKHSVRVRRGLRRGWWTVLPSRVCSARTSAQQGREGVR